MARIRLDAPVAVVSGWLTRPDAQPAPAGTLPNNASGQRRDRSAYAKSALEARNARRPTADAASGGGPVPPGVGRGIYPFPGFWQEARRLGRTGDSVLDELGQDGDGLLQTAGGLLRLDRRVGSLALEARRQVGPDHQAGHGAQGRLAWPP